MIDEVKQRIEIIISVQGTRELSQENLVFLFDKYTLSPEERDELLQYCRERQIRLYSELDSDETVPAAPEEAERTQKRGFFARLFGR